jgi:predicted nucleic acid-binding protein
LIKLIIDEPGSYHAEALWDQASALITARIGYVEARAALAAARRDRRLNSAHYRHALADLDMLWTQLSIVEITAELIDQAVELAEQHSLRGYDAVHLAAALIAGSEVFTSADRKLCDAARAAGLHVANPTET